MSMGKHQGRLCFEYEVEEEDDGSVTSLGGLPLVVEAMRALGVTEAVKRHVKVAKQKRQHDEAALVEAFALLFAAGGDCLDDMRVLSEDKALCRLLERELPSPETLRKFLYACHDESLVEAARAAAQAAGEASCVPEESAPLAGLAAVQTHLVREVAARLSLTEATLDIDATLQESHKKEATWHYDEGRGYQPVVASWAEAGLVVSDEYRDGNVPAASGTLRMAQKAFAALPPSVTTRRLRADSAFYDGQTLVWLAREGIEFSVSADMTRSLREEAAVLPESHWTLLEGRAQEDVHFASQYHAVTDWPAEVKPLRFWLLRFTPKQGKLFEGGAGPKYLAVCTNRRDMPGDALIRWHWGKAGTIEQVHNVVKNELGGAPPCGRFGANAAYFRLVLLTYNLLTALKTTLPPDLKDARPKRLRLHVFNLPAVVALHARQLWAKLKNRLGRAGHLALARRRLWRAHAPPLLAA